VIAGWGLALAAKKLGLPEVPAVTITDLDEAKLWMLRLALNRLSEDSRWDLEALMLELPPAISGRAAIPQNEGLRKSASASKTRTSSLKSHVCWLWRIDVTH
jgi:ParB-like chromosome segregation protein Spo0J